MKIKINEEILIICCTLKGRGETFTPPGGDISGSIWGELYYLDPYSLCMGFTALGIMQSQARKHYWAQAVFGGFLALHFVIWGAIYPNFYDYVPHPQGYVPTKFGRAAPNIFQDKCVMSWISTAAAEKPGQNQYISRLPSGRYNDVFWLSCIYLLPIQYLLNDMPFLMFADVCIPDLGDVLWWLHLYK